MSRSKRSWAVYPAAYRAEALKIVAEWIKAGESGSIIGLAGAGKSNLLSFLSHRPEVLAQYLPGDHQPVVLVHIDLNNLPTVDLATFYRVILRSLYETGAQFAALNPDLEPMIEGRYRKVEDKTDPFLCQSAVREVLLSLQIEEMRIVLLIDPFDQFCQVASTPILDSLRGLRDRFKANLTYLIGLRHELAYLRDPAELGELYEILDIHQCWVGPMTTTDARWVMSQVEEMTGQTFTNAQRARLAELTGGYPALLRAASLWLVAQLQATTPLLKADTDTWISALLAEPSLKNRLYELRLGLTGEEEAALSVLQMALTTGKATDRHESLRQIEKKHETALHRLETKGICHRGAGTWQIFSPLFARFMSEAQGLSNGKIWEDVATARFFLGDQELSNLTEKDRQLLHHFLENPLTVHTLDDLIEAAWPEDDSRGVSDAAVQQAIRHLRKQIEPNPSQPCYLVNERGVGYRFFAEGAPRH